MSVPLMGSYGLLRILHVLVEAAVRNVRQHGRVEEGGRGDIDVELGFVGLGSPGIAMDDVGTALTLVVLGFFFVFLEWKIEKISMGISIYIRRRIAEKKTMRIESWSVSG